ncbi:glycosyl-4,4'-diaponeurosporenoate acyltransferase CrtO family protein [[Ruminococcus] lactaris]|uniref:glycosyl-4,4'-diaponeurosporenoate acyltransferase CrtO family protein n=1 Tax=[Ruminococcus] lactaris TaxID=46228 RepID=UPI003FD8997C
MMEMKSRLPQIIYTLTAIFTAGTVATTVLYQSTSKEILLTLAITFGTCAYHFIMRLLVGSIVNSILHNKVDYCKRWFQVSESEKKIYEKLGVKKWKNKMPTYRPDWFDPRLHSWKEIAQIMCQSEVGHEIIAVLSFLPVSAGIKFGAYPVFIITSIVSAGMDLIFVIMQRYNRQRIMKILAAKK